MPLGAEHGKGWSTDYMTLDIQTIRESPGRYVVFDKDLVLNPSPEFFQPESWFDQAEPHVEGRGTVWMINAGEQQWILKHYLRGGLISHLVSARYFFTGYERTRMANEFSILQKLYLAGLPVPRPVAASAQRKSLLTYSGALITEYLPNSRSLASLIRLGDWENAPWEAIGKTIRRFHEYGAMHRDLNASNILLVEGCTYLIDFDKGKLVGRRSKAFWKQTNLRRLRRSLNKLSGSTAAIDSAWSRMLTGYDAEPD